jgi:hypothetical protein
MPPNTKTAGNLALAPYDNIFKPTTAIIAMDGEQIVKLSLTELHPPEFHPFQEIGRASCRERVFQPV